MQEQDTNFNTAPLGQDESFAFICYAREDSDVVFPIMEGIDASGYPICYDRQDRQGGEEEKAAAAIARCRLFFVFISKNSTSSLRVASEIEMAQKARVKIIPIFINGTESSAPSPEAWPDAIECPGGAIDAERLVSQICEAASYNDVVRRSGIKGSRIRYKKYGNARRSNRIRFLPIALAAMLVIATGTAGWKFWKGASLPPAAARAVSRSGVFEPGEPAELDEREIPVTGGYVVSLDKSVYAPGETVTVSVASVPQEMIDEAIVGIYEKGADHGEYLSYEYIHSPVADIRLRAPANAGLYEIRGYADGGDLDESILASIVRFSVEGNSWGAYSIAVEKSRYAPDEEITVKINDVPRKMADDGAFVGIYRSGAGGDEYISSEYIDGEDGVKLPAPSEDGEYEVRGYTNGSVCTDSTLAASARFSVGK
ncbi:MAG: TIR domain-containing protein [Synergistaceae bacterium]|jgi:hypothetical protein|nr:TIR domain-containing protein [Synergistaceae bacterium]